MKKFFILVAIVATSILSKELVSQPVTPEDAPCPCSALYPGYYFPGQYYPSKPVLFSNMTLDELVGYIIMDSIITHAKDSFPTWQKQENFIKSLTCTGDTLRYAMRYLYRMADENPFLYYNFLTSSQKGKLHPMTIHSKLMDQINKECGLPAQEVMKAEYILHLRVNAVEQFKYESDYPGDTAKLVYVYAQILDTIKGKKIPNMSTAIEVFEQDSSGTKVKKMRPLNVPPNTDFIYWYNPGLMSGGEVAGDEYITFTFNMGNCINSTTGLQYYDIRPTMVGASRGLFPIINGNVYDRGNQSWKWGEYIPVNVFKQNLQSLINSIKDYGD